MIPHAVSAVPAATVRGTLSVVAEVAETVPTVTPLHAVTVSVPSKELHVAVITTVPVVPATR